MTSLIYKLRHLPLRQAMELYNTKLQLAFTREAFQLDDWITATTEQKAVFVRSRGGSKTNDFVDWLIFHVLRTNEQWAWLACKGGQLQQAMLYVRQNPFVKHVKRETAAKFDVTLWSGKMIRFGIISTSNLGLRVDGIIYDEFEDLKPLQEAEIYPQMAGMMTHSVVHKTIYLGTLWIAALLNDYAEMYHCVVRPWDTIPWLVKAGMIQDEIDAGITPQWEIDLMYNCIPTAPHGIVFPNVIEEPLQRKDKGNWQYGLDFGATDHCVGVEVNGDDLYVLEEFELSLEANNAAFDFLKGKRVEAEGGGYNDSDKYAAKCKLLQRRVGAARQPVTNKWKSERVMLGRRYKIHVDKNKTPGIYKDLKSAIYGPDGQYLKDATHPNHWLDAFLHSLSPSPMKVTEYKRKTVNMHQPDYGNFGAL